jgi:outer membrane cobalamin receptor
VTGARLAAVCGVVVAVLSPARAQDLSDLEGLLDEAVVSTASLRAEEASTAPATVTTITAEEMRRHGINSLNEALNFLSLGMVTEGASGTVEIGARGVLIASDYGAHVLVLVNGHPVNEPWDGTAYFDRGLGIPWELVDHLEVILGPGSVLYGSHAMLGVINVVTKRAKDFRGVRMTLESEVPTSIRGALGFGQEFRLLGVPAELTLAMDLYSSHGPPHVYGPQDYGLDAVTGEPKRFSFDGEATGIWGGRLTKGLYAQVPSGLARLQVGGLELTVRGSMFKRARGASWGTFNDPHNWERDRWLSVDLRHTATLTPIVKLSTRAFLDLYDYTQRAPAAAAEDCLEDQLGGCVYHLRGVARWGGLDVLGTFDWLKDGRLVTLAGMDGRLRHVSSEEAYEDVLTGVAEPTGYRERDAILGAYVEQTGRPAPWLGVNAGARLDYDPRFGAHLSPRMVLGLTPVPHTTVKAIYAEAFRAPSAFERSYADPVGYLAAPDLRPEVVRSVEAALEQRLGAQRFRVALFRTWWRDLVVTDDATAAEVAEALANGALREGVDAAGKNRNAAAVDSYGANLGMEGSFLGGRLRHGLSATFARTVRDPRDGGAPVPLPAAAQVFGNARVSYDLGAGLPVVALAVRHEGRRVMDGSSLDPVPYAPPLTEVRGTLSGPVPLVEFLSYRLMANYASTSQSAYQVGPLDVPTATSGVPETVRVRRWLLFAGLSYGSN